MHLALAVPGDLGRRTGGYLYARQLVDHLRRRGDRVTVVPVPLGRHGGRLTGNLDPRLARALADPAFDVVVEDGLGHPALLAANRPLRRRGRPIVALVHLLRVDEEAPAWRRWIERPVERAFLAGADALLTVNAAIAGRAAALAGRPLPTCLAPPAADHLGPVAGEAAIADRARRPGPLRLVFVGAATRAKGLPRLVDALVRLPRVDWRLTAIGRRDAEPRTLAAAQAALAAAGVAERVRFLGELPPDEVRRHLAQGHVLALPSRPESFSVAYLEAWRMGLPVIAHAASDSGRELVRPGVDGLLAGDDPAPLAADLAELACDRAALLALALAGRRRALELPTWSESLEPAAAWLAELAAGRAGRGGVLGGEPVNGGRRAGRAQPALAATSAPPPAR